MGRGEVSHECHHYLSTLFASTINPTSITDVFPPILKHDRKNDNVGYRDILLCKWRSVQDIDSEHTSNLRRCR